MRTIEPEIEEKVDELLACLDTDVRHIEESLSHLNELRSLVIKRDDEALGGLLESLRAKSDRYAGHESQRRSIRQDLANVLGCETEQMTLTALASRLTGGKKSQIIEIQTKLRALTGQLKTEHMSTALLLSECSRLNSLLLRSLFDLGRTDAVYYNSSGTAKRQMDRALMNLQL